MLRTEHVTARVCVATCNVPDSQAATRHRKCGRRQVRIKEKTPVWPDDVWDRFRGREAGCGHGGLVMRMRG
jgi:ribosomal protein L40E